MRVKVEDVMTSEVVSVNMNTPFKDVAEVLIAHGVSAVPVVDDEDHVMGVISELDLLRKEEFKEQYYGESYQPPLRTRLRQRLSQDRRGGERKAHGGTAGDLMTVPAVTIEPTVSLVMAIRRMNDQGVKRMPVVTSEGRLVGVVSRADLLKVFIRTDEDIAREIREEVLGRDLWMDTSAVKVAVEHGIVTLTGHMERRSEAGIAARMAGRVNGVIDVTDKVAWAVDDAPAKW